MTRRLRPDPFLVRDDDGEAYVIAKSDAEACMLEGRDDFGMEWSCSRLKGHQGNVHVACTFSETKPGMPPDEIQWIWRT